MNFFSKSNLTLLNKIMVAFVAYIMLILIIFSAIVIMIDRGEVKAIADDYSLAMSSNKSLVIESWINERISDVEVLALTEAVTNYDEDKSMEFLKSVVDNQPGLYGRYFVVNLDGIMKDTHGITEDISSDEGFNKAKAGLGEVVITKPSIDPLFEQASFKILVPIVVEGKVEGVFGSTILLKALAEYISVDTIGDKGHTWIVDGDGQVISHNDSKKIIDMTITSADEKRF